MRARVLIAEDEFLIAETIRRQIESHGHEVTAIAGTREEAVAVARARRPDLVLADIRTARTDDGLTATRAIMEESPTCVIAIMGRGDMQEAAEAAEAMAYVGKPLVAALIPELVKQAQSRFRRFQAPSKAITGPKKELQVWPSVQTAIRKLMDAGGISEEEALDHLQQLASLR